VSGLLSTLRAIVRDELARRAQPELATVTRVWPRDSDDSKSNHQVSLRLRGSGAELERVPVAVPRLGLSALPNEGDLMLVAFVGGDLNAPVALGCLYDEQAHPPVAQLHEVVYQPPDESDSGVRRFHCELANGATLTWTEDKLEITLGDTSISVAQDGDLTLAAKGNLKLTAQGDVELTAQGDLKLTAQGQLQAKGSAATVEGQSQASFKAPQLAIAGMLQLSPS
jgi:uncharacterized protein involved in type VI secretion and phage assembly